MKKKLLNNIISYLDKNNTYSVKAYNLGIKKARLAILVDLQSSLLPSPISPEDEGYNQGIEAAIKKVKGIVIL